MANAAPTAPKSSDAKSTQASPKTRASKPRAGKEVKADAASSAAAATPGAKASKLEKPAKTKKPKLVRDSFTIPKAEYSVLDELKLRAVKLAQPVKKSELLRAGIKALSGMSDKTFLETLQAVPAIKTGRPKKS